VEKFEKEDVLGIVPVENILNGSVRETLDLLFKKNVFVINEIIIFIIYIV
jgi:prephenate dehydratase